MVPAVRGLILAAGAGRRMGMPKALVRRPDGTPWVAAAVSALRDGGCVGVTVVLGAGAGEARSLVPDADSVDILWCADWDDGMGASLRAGLTHLVETASDEDCDPVDSAAVHLVDLPDVGADVVARLLAEVAPGDATATLARAAYDGVPGHPVLIGADHWRPLLAEVSGDAGARSYLARHEVRLVECGDLATGHDHDEPASG